MNEIRSIVVRPAAAAREAAPLLQALEAAYPVRFHPSDDLSSGMDGLVSLSGPAPRDLACPALAYVHDGPPAGSPHIVRFGTSDTVDSRLRRKSLRESAAAPCPLSTEAGDDVMAEVDGAPVWVRRRDRGGGIDLVAYAPPRRRPDEPLKQHLRAGRFIALLVLVEFVRRLTAGLRFEEPSARALIVIDDPNLRWPSYGFVSYPDLLRLALEHRFHVAMAFIPLDTWPTHRRTVAIFREHPGQLSLVMHGMRHTKHELMRHLPADVRQALVAHALRKIARFEARTRLRVPRVMVAPHCLASEEYVHTMLMLGMEAFLADLPHPWETVDPPVHGPPLLGWTPSTFIGGGLPILPRYPLTFDPDELVLRAFLGLPLVLYEHHDYLSDGPEPLLQWVELANSVGADWGPADSLARRNYSLRRSGDRLSVGLYARRVEVAVPSGVETLEVCVPPVQGEPVRHEIVIGKTALPIELREGDWTTVQAPVAPGSVAVRLRLEQPVDPWTIPGPTRDAAAVVRRAMTESRDRAMPLLARWRRLAPPLAGR